MNDWQKIKDIFAAALEISPENRAEFLRESCGGDTEVLREVESLLAEIEEPEHLIERDNYGAAKIFKSKAAHYAGKQFGSYRILREIGRGGMGAVFLAERSDGAFEQKVALKIIRQTFPDAEVERYFLRERQILAALNHPNIAKLLDGGVSDAGELFLAMEYIDGKTLIEYAEDGNLPIEEKLHLFLKICRAVSEAHQNLIVHCDIKPSNIIVNRKGEPKLLDFGLAKVVEAAESTGENQTQTVFRAFTPAYAAPEQIRGGQITTAADVYSLGVILYELLTGEKPFQFDGKNLDEIIRTIDFKEPPKPSTVQSSKFKVQSSKFENRNPKSEIRNPKSLSGDLDNIILKSLEKEPARRYKSVEALADDIERHLKHLPVAARPNTFSYRASRFYRRNKISVIAVSLVILALASGLTIALWQAKVARDERIRAERRFADVRQLSNSLLSEIAPKLENLSGSTEAREILVSRALEYLDNLAAESQNDPQLNSELAAAYEKIGDLQGNPQKPNLSDFPGAVESYRKANQIRRALPETDDNLSMLAKNYLQSSAVRYVQNDFQGAIHDSEESLKIYENLTAKTGSEQLKKNYLEARIDNAQIYADNNQYKTAIPLFEKILRAVEPSNDKEIRRLLVKAETYYANALSWDDRQAEAEAELKIAVADAEKLFADFQTDGIIRKQLWRTYSLASTDYENVDNRISYDFAAQAFQIAQSDAAADQADAQAKQNLGKAYSRLGNCAVLTGKLSEAVENLQKSEKISLELIEKEPGNITYLKDFGRLYIRLGDLNRKQNDLPDALENYEKSVSYFEKVAAMDENYTLARRDAAQSMKNVGEIQLKLGRKSDAKQTFQSALAILTELKANNALGEYDEKMIAEIQNDLLKP